MWKHNVYKTVQKADSLFERSIRKIVYCYGQWQECFKDIAPRVTFVEGIPEDIPSLFPPNCRPGILILDDERILDLFTKVSHHCDVTKPLSTGKVFSKYLFECALRHHI